MNNQNYLSHIAANQANNVEVIAAIENEKWRNLFDLVSVSLLIIYLVFLPAGIAGLSIVTTSLIIKLCTVNNTTRGIYMLYFGMLTLGMISISFGYPGIGGKIGLAIGIVIIFFTTDISKTIYDIKAPILWLAWISLLLLLFYFNGPMTQYCTDKLINTVINGLLLLIVFYNIFNNRSVEWFNLGQLGILSSYVFLTAGLTITPELKPNSIFDIGIIRTTFDMLRGGTDVVDMQNNIGFLASMGMILMYAASPDRALSRFGIVKLLMYLTFASTILFWVSARLSIASVVIAATLILLMRPSFKKRYILIALLLLGLFIVFIVTGLLYELNFIQDLFSPSDPFIARINREINWVAGYDRFIEKPLLGHGLGGYFIAGYSPAGWGTYAHNLFLELLSETGLIGTMLIISPIFFWRQLFDKEAFLLRAQNGGLVFSILIMVFLKSMISFDLTSSIDLFSVIGAMAVVLKIKNDSAIGYSADA